MTSSPSFHSLYFCLALFLQCQQSFTCTDKNYNGNCSNKCTACRYPYHNNVMRIIVSMNNMCYRQDSNWAPLSFEIFRALAVFQGGYRVSNALSFVEAVAIRVLASCQPFCYQFIVPFHKVMSFVRFNNCRVDKILGVLFSFHILECKFECRGVVTENVDTFRLGFHRFHRAVACVMQRNRHLLILYSAVQNLWPLVDDLEPMNKKK